jgi:hypothetical protein
VVLSTTFTIINKLIKAAQGVPKIYTLSDRCRIIRKLEEAAGQVVCRYGVW